MFRKIRILLALVFLLGITMLFLDFTGTAHAWLGWMAKTQLLPALLAVNVGFVLLVLMLTLLMGRVYCSVVCPLGVLQDVVAWVSKRKIFRKNKKARLANRYSYSPEKRLLRWGMLGLFVLLMVLGVSSVAMLLAPYSTYGRMAAHLLQPLYVMGNNVLADMAERANDYTYYHVEVWTRTAAVLAVPICSLVVIAVLAWRGGRTWCNTVCPVGTLLGAVSRFSLFRMVIDKDKCKNCGLCERNCKASCINAQDGTIDYSRCVMCGKCLDVCNQQALTLSLVKPGVHSSKGQAEPVDDGRRTFLAVLAGTGASLAVHAEEKTVDGGLAAIQNKEIPHRDTPLTPPGSRSRRSFQTQCTACQLCIANCPNGVLRPSMSDPLHFMQPEMEFERGYCRPECNRCSQVCPTGAIKPISVEDRTAVQVGHAVWVADNCLANRADNPVRCNNCERHCPAGAIQMIEKDGRRIPAVDVEKCIGCGACEHLCPAHPTAMYVEGHEKHREV